MYDNVWEGKKDGYDFNWGPPNVADTNHSKLLRASHASLEALPTLTSNITSLIDHSGQANIALAELVSTIMIQLVTVRDTTVTRVTSTVQYKYKVLYNTGTTAHR